MRIRLAVTTTFEIETEDHDIDETEPTEVAETIAAWLDDGVIALADLPVEGTQAFSVAVGEPD